MKDLAEWLIHIEGLAGGLYQSAARCFKNDAQLAGFLRHLAEEEALHSRVMTDVADYLERHDDIVSAVDLDAAAREKIEARFLDCGRKLGTGAMQREHLIDCIVSSEFSEWNDVFVYVMSALKDAGREFAFTASTMQAHRRYIESFIGSLPEGGPYLRAMQRVQPLWQTRILIVEDDPSVRDFLGAVLSADGLVKTAANGKEALNLAQELFFDAIVSDVDMPVMNGIEFYEAAVRFDPDIGKRLLFLSGNPSSAARERMKKDRLRFLAKPVHLSELERAVAELLDKYPCEDPPGGRDT